MTTPDNLSSILKVLVWPSVVLLLGVLFLILCRKEIRGLIKRLHKAKFPGGTETLFGYGDAAIDKQAPPGPEVKTAVETEQPTQTPIKWGNSGNLFWIGHDLMWTIDVTVRGAPRDTIVHGLRQSLHHLRSLGFIGTPIESRLARLKNDAEKSLQQDWTPSQCNSYAEELASMIGYIGELAKKNQPDFQSHPMERYP